jgi:phage terminase large subunit-like protein
VTDIPPASALADNYWFDEAAASAAVSFFTRYLRLTEGEWAGSPFRLEKWQESIIRDLFGHKRADGTRRYRRCYVWVPRKNGKTELAAGVALLMLLGDAESGGQVFSIAKDKEQARLVFGKATSMVQWSPELSREIDTFKTSLWCTKLNAAFRPLTGNASGKHGLSMSGLVGDEIHEWPNGDLYNFVHQSSAARRQPLEFLISTAGDKSGYGWEIWQTCQAILNGEIDDPETLVVIFAADPDADWTSPDVWAQANPNLGISVKRDYLAAECQKALQSPRLENNFKRYHLNMWTEQATRWLPIRTWDESSGNVHWSKLEASLVGRRAYAGLDLSTTTDLTALVWVFPPEETEGEWTVLPRFFVPQENIEMRVKTDRVPYDKWQREGALIATPGNVVDYDFVKTQIFQDAEKFRCDGIAIDRFNATQITIQLANEGLPAILFGQGFVSMSAPSKELERMVLAKRVKHGGHPVLRWCVRNVAVVKDAVGNLKPSKAVSRERIDGVVAMIMGIGLSIKNQAATDGDLMVL